MRNNLIIFGIIILVAGAGYAAYKATSPVSDTARTETYSSPLNLSRVQAGNTITIDTVLLKSRGFIVVRKEESGQAGGVIGISKLLPEGENKNVLINLTERVREGENIYITMHEDGDGNGIFKFPGPDVPAMDSHGNMITLRMRTEPGPETEVASGAQVRKIEYSLDGFSPQSIEISPGDIITFINTSDLDMWIAGDPHPAHNLLPGFDQRSKVGFEGRFSFTFTQKGTWGYHNEINPAQKGTIVVK